jgi:hypothetical protein
MPFTLTVFRGEKSQWWPKPEIRLMNGMTLYQPWLARPEPNVQNLWKKLTGEIGNAMGLSLDKKVAIFAAELRRTGKSYAVATAWTVQGSFDSDYNYVIKIPNVRLYYWGGTKQKPDLGEEVTGVTTPDSVKKDFIVLNATTVALSTVLGFGHNTATKEITFFHDLPIGFIESVTWEEKGTKKKITKKPEELELVKYGDLDYESKVKYIKFKRP